MAKEETQKKAKKAAAIADKKEEKAPSRAERAAALLDHVKNKLKGRAEICMASDLSLPYLTKRFPTGLLSLDLELRGGFPCGGLSQIFGPKNSGKSWLTWQIIRQLQYLLGDKLHVLLAMTEMRADRSQARAAGVQIAYSDEDIALFEKARIENGGTKFSKEEMADFKHEVGTIHEVHGVSGEALYDTVLKAVEMGVYHLIIIDSIGNIMSEAEAELESIKDKTYGGAAGPNTQFLKKLSGLLLMRDEYGKTRDVCIIGINQIRDNIADPNKEFKVPGGKLLEHAKFVDLFVASGKSVGFEAPVMTPEGMKQRFIRTGKEVNWKIEKGKAGIHEGGTGSWIYRYDTNSADFYTDTFVAGVRNGVINYGGGGFCEIPDPTDPTKNLVRIRGREAFVEALRQDDIEKSKVEDPNTLTTLIRNLCYRKAGINITYDWDE